MTERNDATAAPKTLVGLGPPGPPEPLEVLLEKTDAKDAPVETMRAWATSGGRGDVLAESTLDELEATLLPGDERARMRRAFVTAGALACAAMFALTFALGRAPSHPPPSRPLAKAARTQTALVGGPWVLRSTEETPEEAANAAPPEYLRRTPDAPRARHVPSVRVPVPTTSPLVESAPVQAEGPSGAPAEDPSRIRAVADAVQLDEDEETAAPAPRAEP
jgi:hypothetical protein